MVELGAVGLPVAEARLLRRCGRVRDSAGLSVAQRRANLAGTFVRCAEPPSGAALVLVDDVEREVDRANERAVESARASPLPDPRSVTHHLHG